MIDLGANKPDGARTAMRTAIYLRVSTSDQDTALQREGLEAYIAQRGWSLVSVFEDTRSGTTMRRQALQELLASVKRGGIDVVIVWKLDRLARSLNDLLNILKQLDICGVKFISINDNIDMTTPVGVFLLQILGAVSEFEASMIKERIRFGVRRAIARGKRWGAPRLNNDKEIFALKAKGLTQAAIAHELGVSIGTVNNRLKPR